MGEMSIEYCPTGDMFGNFFTKPTKGKLFRKQRWHVMNLESDNQDDYVLSGLQECVGKDVLTSTAVEVHTSANMEHATAVVQTDVRHNMTFAEVAMQGLRKSTEDYMYSHQLPREVRA